MLHQMKKPVALFSAFILCLSMLTGIVLPQIAETATAVADPYADVHTKVTQLTVTDGKVTPAGADAAVTIPNEYSGLPIYEAADEKLFFYNSAWDTPAKAGVSAAGDYFVARYGDGVTWGDGRVYLMQYGVNAFGGTNAGTYALDKVINKLQQIVPTAGGDNNYYVLFFPGTYGNTNSGSSSGHMFKDPTNADPAQSDIMNIHYVGPQAGKSPTMGIVGNTAVNNGRSVDTTREFVTTGTFWVAKNAYTVIDGLATTCAQYYLETRNDVVTYAGLELRNIYARLNADYYLFRVGDSTVGGSKRLIVDNCYFDYVHKSGTKGQDGLIAHQVEITNCVFNNVIGQYLSYYPMDKAYASSAFNGGTGKYVAKFDNNTVVGWSHNILLDFRVCGFKSVTDPTNSTKTVEAIGDYYADGYVADGSASVSISNNQIINLGNASGSASAFKVVGTGNEVKCADGSTVSHAAVGNPFVMNIEDNYVSFNTIANDKKETIFLHTTPNPDISASQPINVNDNTVVMEDNIYYSCDFYSSGKLVDVSGNLFLRRDGSVRVPSASWVSDSYTTNYKVCSDIYASDQFSGGIRELFTVIDAKQDLFVANSHIQTIISPYSTYSNTYGNSIPATLTIMPKPGVTYQTKDLFEFANPNVAFVGVFSDPACTTPVSSFNSTFTKLYAKAEYQAGSTTATAVYTIYQPENYYIVSLSGATSYTFPYDGITYTNGAKASNGVTATFYTTFSAAANAAVGKRPLSSVANTTNAEIDHLKAIILLTPGTYPVQSFGYGAAIVGPQLGVSPSDGKTDVVQNGRSTDASKEAVLNLSSAMSLSVEDNPYYAIGGIAVTGTNRITYNGTVANQRVAHLSIQDTYFNMSSGGTMTIGAYGNDAGKHETKCAHYDARFIMDNSYYKNAADGTLSDNTATNLLRITNSTLYFSTRGASAFYQVPLIPELLGCTPAMAVQQIENCYWARPKATAYGNTFRSSYYTNWTGNTNCFAPLVHGGGMKFNNNTVVDTNILIRAMFHNDNSFFEFCGNKINNPTSIGTALIDTYAQYGTMKVDTKVENNVVLNRTAPFSFGSFTPIPDVNENFYGDLNGKVITVADTANIELDTSWYYVNEACTVKSSDIALVKGGFVGVEIVDGFKDYEAVLTATAGRTYGVTTNFAARNADLIGVYSDPACEFALKEVKFEGADKVVYVKFKKDNYIATWKVTLKLASVWGEKGLAPTGNETFVDLTAADSYSKRTGGNSYPFVFLSDNWTNWAYTDETLTTKSSSIESNLEEGTDGVNWNAHSDKAATTDPRELKVGTVFYAKMPTTGIIYKLTYGVTAMNSLHCNTANFATLVFFPGMYNKQMGYDSSSAANNYRPEATGGGWVGLFRAELSACTEFNILGPQAGIPGGSVEHGTGRESTSYAGTNSVLGEAVFAYATPFYIMNGALGKDDVVNIDGIGGGWGCRLSTAAGGGASNMYSNSDTSTININNCSFRGLDGGQYFIQFHGNGEEINTNLNDDNNGSSGNANATKHNLIVNFNRTCIELDANGKNFGLAKMSANQIHFDECVLLNKRASSTDPYGFYINPVRGDKNATKVDISYTCENSYLDWQNGYLFGVYLNGTTGLNKNNRNKIEVAFRNNTIINPAKNDSNNTRAALASFYSDANSGNNLADAAAITQIEMTGNTVTNTASGYPTYGFIIYGFDGTSDNFNGYQSVNISNNTFKGYNNLFPYFDKYDLSDNIYLDNNGRFMSGRFHPQSRCYTTDIVLAHDYSKHASDFAIKAGLDVQGSLTWAPGALDITGNATRVYSANLKAADIENSLVFASDNIKVVDLYEDDGITPATNLAAGTNYRLVLTYKDTPDLVRVVYNVTIGADPANIPLYEGPEIFYDPDVAGMTEGTRVVRTIADGDYQFVVGKNVLPSLRDFEVTFGLTDVNGNAACARHVYLFAKEYGTPVGGMSIDGDYRHMTTYFYGVQHGVSAVTTAGGIATAANPARRDPAKESVFRDASFTCGYQTNAVFDGVMFAGYLNVSDSSPERGTYISEFVVKNCTTHPDAPVYGNGNNWKCFAINYGQMMYSLKFQNNYFEAADTGNSGNLIVSRNTADIEITNNVFVPMGSRTGFLYDSVEDSTGKGVTNASLNYHNVTVAGNTLSGRINIDSLRTQKALTGNFPSDIKVIGNNFKLDQQGYGFAIYNYSGSEETGIVDFANTSIEIKDNTFTGGPETTEAIYLYGKHTEGLDDVDFKLFNIVGNTFISTDEAPIGYAINNTSDTVLDASRNTFIGFESNYGYRFYEPAAAKELRVINSDTGLNLGLTEQNVLFTGISSATFTIDGVSYKANAVADGITLANAAASGAKVADGTTITDVATMNDGTVYAFNPAKGMMVKITDADGNVYYNAIPVDVSNTANAKMTFTAQLTTIDNTPVGEEYTVTVYAEPIAVELLADNCKVADEGGNKTLYWEARFKGQHDTYIVDLINKSGFKIVEYGMYYGNDESAVSDLAVNGGYVDGKYTVGGAVLGQKAVYASDADGLANVYLNYSHKFTASVPDETEARYGRMYMTYMVGDTAYTVYSNAYTLTIHVAN